MWFQFILSQKREARKQNNILKNPTAIITLLGQLGGKKSVNCILLNIIVQMVNFLDMIKVAWLYRRMSFLWSCRLQCWGVRKYYDVCKLLSKVLNCSGRRLCVCAGGRGGVEKKMSKMFTVGQTKWNLHYTILSIFFCRFEIFSNKNLAKKNLLILFHPTGTFEKVYPNKRIKVVHKNAWKKYTQHYKVRKAKN